MSGLTYLILDGENIDATLGTSVLGRKPGAEERPRWDRVRTYSEDVWEQPVKALFFLNASSGVLPMPFIQALVAMDYRPIPLAGPGRRRSSTSASSARCPPSSSTRATSCWPATTATSSPR